MNGEKKQMAAPTSSIWMEMEYKVSSRRNTKQRNDGKKEREKKIMEPLHVWISVTPESKST